MNWLEIFQQNLLPLVASGRKCLSRTGVLHQTEYPTWMASRLCVCCCVKLALPFSLFSEMGSRGVKTKYYIIFKISFLSAWGEAHAHTCPQFTLINVYQCTECLPGQDADPPTSPKNLCAPCCTTSVEPGVEMLLVWALLFFHVMLLENECSAASRPAHQPSMELEDLEGLHTRVRPWFGCEQSPYLGIFHLCLGAAGVALQ